MADTVCRISGNIEKKLYGCNKRALFSQQGVENALDGVLQKGKKSGYLISIRRISPRCSRERMSMIGFHSRKTSVASKMLLLAESG